MSQQDVINLEKKLLGLNTRQDQEQVCELLDDSFFEFGASGKVWTKDQVVSSLPNEESDEIESSDFSAIELAVDVILVTYRTNRAGQIALRSSIWKKKGDCWKMVFHQGTPISGSDHA